MLGISSTSDFEENGRRLNAERFLSRSSATYPIGKHSQVFPIFPRWSLPKRTRRQLQLLNLRIGYKFWQQKRRRLYA